MYFCGERISNLRKRCSVSRLQSSVRIIGAPPLEGNLDEFVVLRIATGLDGSRGDDAFGNAIPSPDATLPVF